ncbi:MAG: formylglycine-generating enzyme family protein [Acidobacteria bacterium]|nr:formylglycine-generating enzyme family protein [Acidobacteriota bacterium]
MMSKKALMVLAALILMYGLVACGKKDAEPQEEAAVEPAAPEVVPGEMVLIPEGEFILGTNDKESIAYPEQKVNLPAFWIDKYEVTNMEFLEFSIKNSYAGEGAKEGRDWRLFFTPEKGMFPVVYITWNDADAYCKAQGKRLPTEEEWEKAARGTEGFIYPWGNEWQDGMSNTYESGPAKPEAIGQYNDVSPFGVRDMLGNVQEWTSSWYTTYKGNPKRDPKSGKTLRVVRGLASRYRGKMGHLYDRAAQPPSALYDFGCRCAKDATPEDVAQAAQAR